MAMALRTMAATLKQRIPAAVQRGFASHRAPAARVDPDLDRFGPEIRRALEKIIENHKKRRRDEAWACAAGFGLGALTFLVGVSRLG